MSYCRPVNYFCPFFSAKRCTYCGKEYGVVLIIRLETFTIQQEVAVAVVVVVVAFSIKNGNSKSSHFLTLHLHWYMMLIIDISSMVCAGFSPLNPGPIEIMFVCLFVCPLLFFMFSQHKVFCSALVVVCAWLLWTGFDLCYRF